MDKLDIMARQKQFFKVIYGDLIGDGGNLQNNYIRIFQAKDDFSKIEFFNNVDDLVQYTANRCYDINTYFNLGTTNGESGQEKDLQYRAVLGFDFDKKDLGEDFSYKDIMERFKSLGLWYHCLADSGHGFHTYVCIEPTTDLQKVQEVQKAIGKLLGADLNALKSTQVLRVPYTFNVKDKPKRVNIIKIFPKDTIKRYSIDKLYHRFCCSSFKDTGDRLSQYNIKSSNIPLCVKEALKNGSEDGFKNVDLYNTVIYLKHKGENINYIKKVAYEWNNKNKTQVNKNRLDYQIEYTFNNCNGYRCDNCKYNKQECKSYTISDFNLEQYGEPILDVYSKVGRQCRNSNRKGVICMSGNELFIYNVLLNNKDLNLNIDEIMELITDRKTGKQALNPRTVTKALKELADKDKEYIIINKGNPRKGIKDTYKINPKKIDDTNTFRLTYFINLAVIWGRITTTELRCYTHMRYLHHKQVLDGKAKGNIFTITIEDLAKDMGYSSLDKVKTMLKNLYDNNILDRRAIPKEDNPKIFYYQYKLNM